MLETIVLQRRLVYLNQLFNNPYLQEKYAVALKFKNMA